ncbi:MAG: transcriptional repressor [Planctomycetes bacterium]|nr:transcriptional repressor [Planctomycetota bacterium]
MTPEKALERFEVFLRTKGLRMTAPRRGILLAAWSSHEHFSADQMFEQVSALMLGASRATVYRTLSLLVESGFLSSMNNGKGTMLYEHILGHDHHDHMICRGCGSIHEFHSEDIERLQEEYAAKVGFTLIDHTLRLEGYCASCTKAGPATTTGNQTES